MVMVCQVYFYPAKYFKAKVLDIKYLKTKGLQARKG